MLTITLLSVFALTMFGVGDYAIGRSGRGLNPFIVNFVIQFMSFAVIAPVALFLGLSGEGLQDTFPALLIGLAFGVGFYYYVRAMSIGPMGVAAPLVNGYAVVTLLVGLLFFGVMLSVATIIALAMVAIGAILLTFSGDMLKGKFLYSKTARFAGASMIIQGSAFAFLNPIIQRGEWYEVLFLMSLGTLIATSVLLLAKLGKRTDELRVLFSKRITVAVIGGLFTGTGVMGLFWAGGLGDDIILPAVVSAASPLMTSLLAFFIDKERILLINRIGAVAVVAGIILLNI